MSQYQHGHEDGKADAKVGNPPRNTELMINAGYRNGYRAGYADEADRQHTEKPHDAAK